MPSCDEAPAEFDEDPPHAAEESCPLESEILAIAHARARLAQHPAEDQRAQRPARRTRPRPVLRIARGSRDSRSRWSPAAAVASRSAIWPTDRKSGSGSSWSVGLSSFSSSRQRSPNRSRYSQVAGGGCRARRSHFLAGSRHRVVAEDGHEVGSGGGDLGHLPHAPRRLGADHPAFAAQQIVLQGSGVAAPAVAEAPQHAEEDHGEEVVDQRRVPAGEELALEVAVIARRARRAACLRAADGGGERVVQASVEARDARRTAGRGCRPARRG